MGGGSGLNVGEEGTTKGRWQSPCNRAKAHTLACHDVVVDEENFKRVGS